MRAWLTLAVQLVALVALALAKSATGSSVLIVLEKDLPREDFSNFFSSLEGARSFLRGNNLH